MTLQFVYEISFCSPDLPSEATTLIILVGSSVDRRVVGGIEARGGGGATRGWVSRDIRGRRCQRNADDLSLHR